MEWHAKYFGQISERKLRKRKKKLRGIMYGF